MIVIPAILTSGLTELESKLGQAAMFSDFVQIDFFDARFVPGYSGLPPRTFKDIQTKLKLIAHILAFKPLDYLVALKKGNFSKIIFHLEATDSPDETIARAHELNFEVGIGINPGTDANKLAPFTELVDEILFLAVEPECPGVFIPSVLDKLTQWRQEAGPSNCLISIDGGVDASNITDISHAKIDVVYAGNAIFAQGDPRANWQKLARG